MSKSTNLSQIVTQSIPLMIICGIPHPNSVFVYFPAISYRSLFVLCSTETKACQRTAIEIPCSASCGTSRIHQRPSAGIFVLFVVLFKFCHAQTVSSSFLIALWHLFPQLSLLTAYWHKRYTLKTPSILQYQIRLR